MKILVLNCGSSSIKYQVIDSVTEQPEMVGLVERIGESSSLIRHKANGSETEETVEAPDHVAAMAVIGKHLNIGGVEIDIQAVGHRVVHGGEFFFRPALIDDEVEASIEACASLAPLHNPPNLIGIRAARKLFPNLPHVAVFDTAFHQTMPREAWCYALPWAMYEKHRVRRYGFHGTSHHYVSQRGAEMMGDKSGFTGITLHLGNGCSAAAIQNGKCVDTSMGLTPLEGLVMGTRCGDIDPAIVLYLAEKEGCELKDIDRMMNRESGLKGVSGIGNDVRELEKAAAEGHDRAALALDVYARRVRKYVGSYLSVLENPRAIVFTGGVGENGAKMRQRIVGGLKHLGVELDAGRNDSLRGEGDIATESSPVRILIVPTREELMIARETKVTVAAGAGVG